MNIKRALIIGLVLIGLDILTKWAANVWLADGKTINFWIVTLTLHHNLGTHWLLGNMPGWLYQTWVPSGIVLGLVALIAGYFLRTRKYIYAILLIGVMANLIEMIVFGRRTDFFGFTGHPLLANLSDLSGIVLQALLICEFVVMPLVRKLKKLFMGKEGLATV